MANGNVVTNYTRTAISAYLAGLSLYLGVGIGTTTPAAADTALGTEVTSVSLGNAQTYTRPGSFTGTQVTTTVTNDTAQWSQTWTNPSGSANTIAVTEAGIFSTASAGNMYYRTVFSVFSIAPGFGITVQAGIVAG